MRHTSLTMAILIALAYLCPAEPSSTQDDAFLDAVVELSKKED